MGPPGQHATGRRLHERGRAEFGEQAKSVVPLHGVRDGPSEARSVNTASASSTRRPPTLVRYPAVIARRGGAAIINANSAAVRLSRGPWEATATSSGRRFLAPAARTAATARNNGSAGVDTVGVTRASATAVSLVIAAMPPLRACSFHRFAAARDDRDGFGEGEYARCDSSNETTHRVAGDVVRNHAVLFSEQARPCELDDEHAELGCQ